MYFILYMVCAEYIVYRAYHCSCWKTTTVTQFLRYCIYLIYCIYSDGTHHGIADAIALAIALALALANALALSS